MAPSGHSATASGIAEATLAQAWDISGPVDPTKFYPKSGALPAVVEVRNQSGTWDTPGHTRQLMLSDGGSVIETITDADRPDFFAYELTEFQKLFGKLVHHARAEWRFIPADGGTRITWTYTFFPLPGAGLLVGLIVRLLWAGYMKRVLPGILAEVSRVAAAA